MWATVGYSEWSVNPSVEAGSPVCTAPGLIRMTPRGGVAKGRPSCVNDWAIVDDADDVVVVAVAGIGVADEMCLEQVQVKLGVEPRFSPLGNRHDQTLPQKTRGCLARNCCEMSLTEAD